MIRRNYEIWWQKYGINYWTLHPKPATEAQKKIIYNCVNAYQKGYRKIIIHAGVGLGKSAIATTLMRIFDKSYVLTMTTQLQDQYIDDYDKYLVELKGRSNYNCNYGGTCDNCYIRYVNEHKTPDLQIRLELLNTHGRVFEYAHPLDELWTHRIDDEYYFDGMDDKTKQYWEKISELPLWFCNDCEYLLARDNAKNSNHVVANYDSLYFNSCVYPFFDNRHSIFFDECHNIEKLVSKWFTIPIKPGDIYEEYDIDVFEDKTYSELDDIDYWIKIFEEIIIKLAIQEEEEINKFKGEIDDNYLNNIKKEYKEKKNH